MSRRLSLMRTRSQSLFSCFFKQTYPSRSILHPAVLLFRSNVTDTLPFLSVLYVLRSLLVSPVVFSRESSTLDASPAFPPLVQVQSWVLLSLFSQCPLTEDSSHVSGSATPFFPSFRLLSVRRISLKAFRIYVVALDNPFYK